MATCSLYKGGTLLGTGSITSGSASVTSWSASSNTPAVARRNVAVTITSSTHSGSTFRTQVLTDSGAGTLTLRDVSPYAT